MPSAQHKLSGVAVPPPRARAPRALALAFFVAVWALYAATSTGTLPADPNSRYEVAEAVVKGHLDVPTNMEHTVVHEGRRYVVFFPGQTLVFLPIAVLSTAAEKFAHLRPSLAALGGRFVTCTFVTPALAALAVLGHVAVLRQLGVSWRIGYGSGVLIAIATPFWVYATTGSEEVDLAAAAIWTAWALLDARRAAMDTNIIMDERSRRVADRIGLAAVLLAVGLIHRGTFIAVIIGLAISFAAWSGRIFAIIRTERLRLAFWVTAAAGILALLPLYDFARFGSPLVSGYTQYYAPFGGAYQTPLLIGVAGHLFSPGKSIFLYAPWLILVPVSLLSKSVRDRLGWLGAGLAVMVAIHLWIYSRFIFWGGDWCWGVRFHASLMPLVTVPIGVALAGWWRQKWLRPALVALAAGSCLIQIVGISLNWGLEHAQHREDFTGPLNEVPAAAAWTWHGSPLRRRFVNLALKLSGRALPSSGDARSRAIYEAWNIFPSRAAAVLPGRAIGRALWIIWAAIILCLALAVRRVVLLWPPPNGGLA